jgi:hypothetical protein
VRCRGVVDLVSVNIVVGNLLFHADIEFIGKFLGRQRICACEPAAEIDIGAALGTERPVFLRPLIAADGAFRIWLSTHVTGYSTTIS